jgi:hypothetical protein
MKLRDLIEKIEEWLMANMKECSFCHEVVYNSPDPMVSLPCCDSCPKIPENFSLVEQNKSLLKFIEENKDD